MSGDKHEAFASRMKELENAVSEAVNMSRLVWDKLQDVDGNPGPSNALTFSTPSEADAFIFGVNEVDRRLRKLREDYLACWDVYREGGASCGAH